MDAVWRLDSTFTAAAAAAAAVQPVTEPSPSVQSSRARYPRPVHHAHVPAAVQCFRVARMGRRHGRVHSTAESSRGAADAGERVGGHRRPEPAAGDTHSRLS